MNDDLPEAQGPDSQQPSPIDSNPSAAAPHAEPAPPYPAAHAGEPTQPQQAFPQQAYPQQAYPQAGGQVPYQQVPQAQPGQAGVPQSFVTQQSPEQLKQAFGKAKGRIGNPVPSILAALAGYGGGILFAALGALLLFLGSLVTDNSDLLTSLISQKLSDVLGSDFDLGSFSGLLFLLGLPAQLVSMAFFGRGHVGHKYTGVAGEYGKTSGSYFEGLYLVPVLVFVTVLTVAFLGGRMVERRNPASSRVSTWVSAFLGGLSVALLSTILTLATAYRSSDSGTVLGIDTEASVAVHASGILPFVALLVLVAVAVALGQLSAQPRPYWWPRISEFVDAMKLVLIHAVTFAVIGYASSIIYMIVRGSMDGADLGEVVKEALVYTLLLPLLGGQVLGWLFGAGHLSSVGGSASQAGFLPLGGTTYIHLFDAPWWVALVVIGFSLLVIACVSVLWSHARVRVPGNALATFTSWAALPTVYFLFGIGLIVASRISGDTRLSGNLEFLSFISDYQEGSWALGLAAWTPLVLLLVGLIIELLARFVAPYIAPYIPDVVGRWVHKPALVAAGPGSAGTLSASNAPVAAGGTPSAPAAPAPGASTPAYASPVVTAGDAGQQGLSARESLASLAPSAGTVAAGTALGVAGSSAPGAPSAADPQADAAGAHDSGTQVPGGYPDQPQQFAAQPVGAPQPQGSTAYQAPQVAQAGPAPSAAANPAAGEAPKPLSAQTKRKLLIAGGVIAGLLLFAISTAIVVSVLKGTVFSPKAQVENYLSAVEEGRFGDAAELAPPNVSNGERVLLSNEIGAKTEGGIDSFTVNDVLESGGDAVVSATVKADGVSSEREYVLSSAGSKFLFFKDWNIMTPEYQDISVFPFPGATLTVNGVEVSMPESPGSEEPQMLSLPAFPGKYTIGAKAPNDYLEASEGHATVPIEGPTQEADQLTFLFNDKAEARVAELVKQHVDSCFKGQTEPQLTEDGCKSFSANTYLSDRISNGSWTINSYPKANAMEEEDGMYLFTEDKGEATFSYDHTDFTGETERQEVPTTLGVTGLIDFDDSGELQIEFTDSAY